jgi:hypothetical protein
MPPSAEEQVRFFVNIQRLLIRKQKAKLVLAWVGACAYPSQSGMRYADNPYGPEPNPPEKESPRWQDCRETCCSAHRYAKVCGTRRNDGSR